MTRKRSLKLFEDTTPAAEAKLMELLRLRTPAESVQMVDQLNAGVRTAAMSGLRLSFPDADEKELKRRLADLILGPDLAARVYGSIESSHSQKAADE